MMFNFALATAQKDFAPEDLPEGGARLLLSIWSEKRGSRLMPSREDISPAEMRSILPGLAMFDVEHDPRRYRVRLYGTGLVDMTGVDLGGRYIDEIPETEQMITRCDYLVHVQKPVFSEGVSARWSDRSWRNYDVLSLPLSQTGEQVDIILFHLRFY